MGRALKPQTQLNPEYERAFKKFQQERIKLPRSLTSLSSSIWITGHISLYKDQIPTRLIPTPFEWFWKQSRPKVVTNNGMYDIILRKLAPRRKKSIPKEYPLPSYKLWEYRVSTQSEHSYTMFWCEKGRNITSAELRMEDFYFLAKFMQPEVAASLWPLQTLLLENKETNLPETSLPYSFQENPNFHFFLSGKEYDDQSIPI